MINIACIGCGYWGNNIIKNLLLMKNYNIKYICDINDNNLYSKENNYIQDYKIILNDDTIKKVFIITPIPTHYNLILEFLNKNKDIFIEKPLCLNNNEMENIEKHNIYDNKIFCDYTFLYSNKIKNLKLLFENENIDNLLHIEIEWLALGKLVNEGVINDLLPHCISILLYLFSIFLNNNELELDIINYDNCIINTIIYKSLIKMKINNKINIFIHLSVLNNEKIRKIKFIYNNKIIEYDDLSDNIKYLEYYINNQQINNNILIPISNYNDHNIIENNKEPLYNSIKSFLDDNLDEYNYNYRISKIITLILDKINYTIP